MGTWKVDITRNARNLKEKGEADKERVIAGSEADISGGSDKKDTGDRQGAS